MQTVHCKANNNVEQCKMAEAQQTANTPKDFKKSCRDLLTETPTNYRKSFENLLALTHVASSSSGLKSSLSTPNLRAKLKSEGTRTKTKSSSTLDTDLDSSISSAVSFSAIDHDSMTHSATKQKSVNFGQIHIRKYKQILGDNPAARTGPPISLGWEYNHEEVVIDVEEYEASQEQQGTRRHGMDLVLDMSERCYLLETKCGCSLFEIRKAQSEAKKIRLSRIETRGTPAYIEKKQETAEKIRRKASNVFSKQRKAEQKIWHDAYHYMLQTLQLQEESRKDQEQDEIDSQVLMESKESISSATRTKKRSSLINTQDTSSEILNRVSNASELVAQLEDHDLADTSYYISKRINSSVDL